MGDERTPDAVLVAPEYPLPASATARLEALQELGRRHGVPAERPWVMKTGWPRPGYRLVAVAPHPMLLEDSRVVVETEESGEEGVLKVYVKEDVSERVLEHWGKAR